MKKERKITEPLLHISIWLLAFVLVLMSVKTIGPFKKVDGTLLLPVTFGTIINLLLFYTASLVLIPRFSDNRKTGVFIASILTLLLTLSAIETIIDNNFFVYYYSQKKESPVSQLVLNVALNFIILSLALGYGFVKTWYKNEKLKQDLIRKNLEAELNLLRTQLNPHFLFNVLNMAFSSASRNGDERTADIIEKLSGMMRYMTYESNIQSIEIEKEIEYLNSYIDLQKMRLSDELPVKISFITAGNTEGLRIAPLLLVPFVENAFKHGIKLGVESNLEFALTLKEKSLIFFTSNPKLTKASETNSGRTGIGIENTIRRLELIYPGRHEIKIDQSNDIFSVTLKIELE